MDYFITDGHLYFGAGEIKKMNIWIQGDKIISIHSDLKAKEGMKSVNAQGYAVFPGLICEASFARFAMNPLRYQEHMINLLNKGFTSFIDVIRWNHNLSLQSLISMAASIHSQSPLDFTYHLSIPISKFKPSLIKEVSKLGIRQITLETNDVKYFLGYDWEAIFSLAMKYGVYLKLYPHTSFAQSKNGKKIVAEITNYWYYLNKKHGRTSLFAGPLQYSSMHFTDFIPFSSSIIKEVVFSPAKNAGIYPQKGSIAVGSDADLIFIPLDMITKKMRIVPHFIFLKGKLLLLPIDEIIDIYGMQLQTVYSGY